jgi:5'-methylthioadenosine/S-adenosylhomocysteine nucleosidase
MTIILGAMDAEIEQFLGAMEDRRETGWLGAALHQGCLAGHEVLVTKSGVGKVMAAMTAQHLIDAFAPDALVFTGLAGGLKPGIDIGDTVVASDLVQHDMDATGFGWARGEVPYTGIRFVPADPALLARAAAFQPAAGRLHLGRICTGDVFMDHAAQARYPWLSAEFDGAAVEMEGAAVALVCHRNGVPCLVARTISDKADGSASVDFAAFLPRASHNSLEFVRHMLGAA